MDRNGKHCHKQMKRFSPFFLSVDGVLGREALFVLVNLNKLMEEKTMNPFCTRKAILTV